MSQTKDGLPEVGSVIYIAGPISGTTNYMERFKEAETKIKELGCIPINPTIISNALLEAKADYPRFISVTKEMLKCCDSIYLLDGWEYSAGAKLELGFALSNNYEVYTKNILCNSESSHESKS